KAKLIVARAIREVCVACRVGCIRLHHELGLHPCFVRIVLRIQPVIDKNEFSVSFRLVTQPIFSACARRLKRDLLPSGTVQAVTRPKVSVKFEAVYLFFQLRNLRIRFPEQVVCWRRWQLALKRIANLIRLSKNRLSSFLSSQLRSRNG